MRRRAGFAMRELIAVVVVVVGLSAMVAVGVGRARQNALMLKDGTQLRSIVQAMDNFAANNRNQFPLPSKLDKNDDTVAGPAEVAGNGWGGHDRTVNGASARAPDVWRYDEPDDVRGSANTYLGIFVKSGKTPADFRAIWD